MATVNTLIAGAKALVTDIILLVEDADITALAHHALEVFQEKTGYYRSLSIPALTAEGDIKAAIPSGFEGIVQAVDASGRALPCKEDGSNLVVDVETPNLVEWPVKIYFYFNFDSFVGNEDDALPSGLPFAVIRSYIEALIRKKNAPLLQSATAAAGMQGSESINVESITQELAALEEEFDRLAMLPPPIYSMTAIA